MHMKVTAVYFSPTGNTKKSVEAMAGALDPNFTVIDVTAPEQASVEREFSSEELVIFGMPVYMGRIPAAAAPGLTFKSLFRLTGKCDLKIPITLPV